jgi:hypothetical protein
MPRSFPCRAIPVREYQPGGGFFAKLARLSFIYRLTIVIFRLPAA